MAPRHLLRILSLTFLFHVVAAPVALYAQAVDGGAHAHAPTSLLNVVFGLLEIPFLVLCIYFAFQTARELKGGVFGRGMMLLAWGFLIMAVGHAHMQIEHFTGLNLFNSLLGPVAGPVAWILALMLTWGLSGIGFYKIYRVSKGAVAA